MTKAYEEKSLGLQTFHTIPEKSLFFFVFFQMFVYKMTDYIFTKKTKILQIYLGKFKKLS